MMIFQTFVIILTLAFLLILYNWSSSTDTLFSSFLSSSFQTSCIIYSSCTIAVQFASTGTVYSCLSNDSFKSDSAILFSHSIHSKSSANSESLYMGLFLISSIVFLIVLIIYFPVNTGHSNFPSGDVYILNGSSINISISFLLLS